MGLQLPPDNVAVTESLRFWGCRIHPKEANSPEYDVEAEIPGWIRLYTYVGSKYNFKPREKDWDGESDFAWCVWYHVSV
jgi:hypothetical protein